MLSAHPPKESTLDQPVVGIHDESIAALLLWHRAEPRNEEKPRARTEAFRSHRDLHLRSPGLMNILDNSQCRIENLPLLV